ncbi:MAG: FkbM family methyltransferase [Alcanivoracaceae bacterium]|nr:FkbM family methyltransferase [Alcanivoracaceae bacterium]
MLEQKIKPYIPIFLRKVFRIMINYFQRIFRWIIILSEMRGVTIVDQMKLMVSALFSPVSSLKNLLQWQNPVLLFDTSVKVFKNGMFNIRAFSDDLWHVLPWSEPNVFKTIQEKLTNESVFVDAGANIGVYTILASMLIGDKGKVLAIEMIPETATILEKHVNLNKCINVNIKNKALSDIGDQSVIAFVPKNKYGMASIRNNYDHHEVEKVSVKTATLDEILMPYSSIDLLKLDIEGAELMALNGCKASLTKINSIIFESHTEAEDIILFLKSNGFRIDPLSGKDMLAVKI